MAKLKNPIETANIVSKILFLWVIPLFKYITSKEKFQLTDLYLPLSEDESNLLGNSLEKQWQKEIKNKKPHFIKAVFRTFWREILFTGILTLITEPLKKIVQPILLGRLLKYFRTDNTVSYTEAWLMAGGIALTSFMASFFINHLTIKSFHNGLKFKVSISTLIFRKSLRLNHTALKEIETGKIINLLSNDVSRYSSASFFLHSIWMAPTIFIVILYLVIQEMSYAGFFGVCVVLIITPLQAFIGSQTFKFRHGTAIATDRRVRLMNEIISGIQTIKMYVWEKPLSILITKARRDEIKCIKKTLLVQSMFCMFNLFTKRLALFVSLLTYAFSDNLFEADKVFVVSAFFQTLSITMGHTFVRGVQELSEAWTSTKRIQEFLLKDEFHGRPGDMENELDQNLQPGTVILENACAGWSSPNTTLSNINFTASPGSLVGIIGAVGSGKSSLIHVLLGELPLLSGKALIAGRSISYSSQMPWIFAGTIKENIIFGQPWNEERYNEVLRACCLLPDIKQMSNGDETLVGERGISLSGGQKARITLARAVYRTNVDAYLLDEPLGALDVNVAKHVFEECIEGLLSDTTRILVTNQVHLLKNVDKIILLSKGQMTAQCTYSELIENNYETFGKHFGINVDTEITSKSISTIENNHKTKKSSGRGQSEHIESGTVKATVYKKYWSNGGSFLTLTALVLSVIFTQLCASGVDMWIAYWTKIEKRRELSLQNGTLSEEIEYNSLLNREQCILIYTCILVLLIIIAVCRTILFCIVCLRSSQNIHDKMFHSLVGAPMIFFANNPAGRILNRFSNDLGQMDEILPKSVLETAQLGLIIIGTIAVASTQNPWFLIPVGVLTLLSYFIRNAYLLSARGIKRLEGVATSPIFSLLADTLHDLPTVRALNAEEMLIKRVEASQDIDSSTKIISLAMSAVFGFLLDLLSTIFIAIVTLSFLAYTPTIGSGASAGLAITQVMGLVGVLQWGVKQTALVETNMTSVERVLEYTELEQEPQPKPSEQIHLPEKWPTEGKIEFKNTCLRYITDEEPVLKNFNVLITPENKIGIVGRTGAGKTSLINALFRMAPIEGSVFIDGIDTSKILLSELRAKISIIPQDPILFSGTLRYNLDPFQKYSDDILLQALEHVELKDTILEEKGLDSPVAAGGTNWSVGQRQLLCLARTILRRNKILVLDEATANIDHQTDSLIQKTLRREFKSCTVLTVAHRLHTIMDSDKVMVIADGNLKEYDIPFKLLQLNNSIFKSMVNDTGPETAKILIKSAKNAYESDL